MGHWRKIGETCCKTPRVELTMRGQEGSGTLPVRVLPATTMTTTTTMQPRYWYANLGDVIPRVDLYGYPCRKPSSASFRRIRNPGTRLPDHWFIHRDVTICVVHAYEAFYENPPLSRIANSYMPERTSVTNLIDRFRLMMPIRMTYHYFLFVSILARSEKYIIQRTWHFSHSVIWIIFFNYIFKLIV